MKLSWDDVVEGADLPPLEKQPGISQLVKYAAGSGDFNPLHYDFEFPQSKLLGSVIVHGRFKYAALGELVSTWLGHAGRIRKISCQYRGMDFPNRRFRCGGKVVRKWEDDGKKLVDLQLWTENDEGKKTTPGHAVVEIY